MKTKTISVQLTTFSLELLPIDTKMRSYDASSFLDAVEAVDLDPQEEGIGATLVEYVANDGKRHAALSITNNQLMAMLEQRLNHAD